VLVHEGQQLLLELDRSRAVFEIHVTASLVRFARLARQPAGQER
jgi:hypothetical protein